MVKLLKFVCDVVLEFVAVAAFPLMLIPHVPVAPEPDVEGTSKLVRASDAVVAAVPPAVKGKVPDVSVEELLA